LQALIALRYLREYVFIGGAIRSFGVWTLIASSLPIRQSPLSDTGGKFSLFIASRNQ
jgi:hypothetical protein